MNYCAKKILLLVVALSFAACESRENIFQGYVEGEYSYIASSIAGKLTTRLVNRGDQVVANQPIFILDPEPETSQLAQAKSQFDQAKQQLLDLQKGARSTIIANLEAGLKKAQAGLDFAEKNFLRNEKLYRVAAIDQSSFEEAKTQFEQNQQQVKSLIAQIEEARLGARENVIAAAQAATAAAQSAVTKAEWALLQKSVRAPLAAQVFDTLYEPGEFVASGQPVVVLLAPQNIKVIFFVPERIVSNLHVGNEIVFDCDSCKNSYKAKINFISPQAEFTPPVIFSQESRDKLVYRVEAKPSLSVAKMFHPGQPIDVIIK